MGKYDRRSRDQKRKAKLRKKAGRLGKHESLAYHGGKYKSAEYVGIIHSSEIGIFETYVLSDRTLTDDAVERALEDLIIKLRQRALPPTEEAESEGPDLENPEDLIAWNIRRNWQQYARSRPLPRREDLIGVLRTILSSLETWRAESMHSQGYLRFLEGFLGKTGVSVQKVDAESGLVFEPLDERLLMLGRQWIEDGDKEAAAAFAEEVEEALEAGDPELVIETCQQLIGEAENPAVIPALQAFALLGHRALPQSTRSSPPREGKWLPGPGEK